MTERYPGEESKQISLWFIPDIIPEGGAPEKIKQQWVGVPLPVRKKNIVSEDVVGDYVVGANILDPTDVKLNEPMALVCVETLDAIKALRLADRRDAAEWWEYWFDNRSFVFGTTLMFQASEGRLLTPTEVEEELPGTNRFEDL